MTVEVKVPSLPESVSDGTLVNWKKKPGEAVKRGENLVDLETDKVVLDIPHYSRCIRRKYLIWLEKH